MKKHLGNILKFVFFLGLGLGLVWWSAKDLSDSDFEEIKKAFRNANYFWVFSSAFLGFISHISRAMRWQMMLEPVAHRPGLPNTASAVFVNYIANLAFPRLGEVMRCGVMKRYEGIPLDKSVGTMITERIIDLVFLVFFTTIVFFTQFSVIGGFFEQTMSGFYNKSIGPKLDNTGFLIGLAVLGIILVIGAIVAFRFFRNSELYTRVIKTAKGIWEGVASVQKMKNKGVFIAHSIFIWTMYVTMTYICFFAMSETADLGFGIGLTVFVAGGFGMLATQGGIGAYHLVVMTVLGLYGVSQNLGFAFAWLLWTTQTCMVIICGFIAIVALAVINRDNKEPKNRGIEEPKR